MVFSRGKSILSSIYIISSAATQFHPFLFILLILTAMEEYSVDGSLAFGASRLFFRTVCAVIKYI